MTVATSLIMEQASNPGASWDGTAGPQWLGSVVNQECTLHQVAPYIGKMKSSMAAALISAFAQPGQTVYDPFCGSGTVALEAWLAGCNVVANDLNPYGYVLTMAKLLPPRSADAAISEIGSRAKDIPAAARQVDLRKVP